MTPRVALATCAELPTSCPDDVHLLEALRKADIDARTIPWDTRAVAWERFDLVLIRATWDYYLRLPEFLRWIGALEASGANVWNPPRVLRWNADKRYLGELAARGIATLPSAFVEPTERVRLDALLRERGWTDAVVKPIVSAGAHATFRVAAADAHARQADFERIVAGGGALVQPFAPEVAQGEGSFLFFDGDFSHAVLKKPGRGDFRVQEKHGGSAARASPTPEQVVQARRAMDAVGAPLLYARVDGVLRGSQFLLMELEVLEPELFFRFDPAAAPRFAEAVRARCTARP